MNLADARKLRDYIRKKAKLKARLMPAHGPKDSDGYTVRAETEGGTVDFADGAAYNRWAQAEQDRILRECMEQDDIAIDRILTRSPIERMIDKACGLG